MIKFNYKDILNTIFGTFFFLLLIFPLLKLNQDEYSKSENRKLYSYKPLLIKNKKSEIDINLNYGTDLNSYVNDRFCLRYYILKKFNIILSFVNLKFQNDRIKAGKNKWYFDKENIVQAMNGYTYFIDNIFESIVKLNDFCCKNNIDLYILFVPFKETIYDDEMIGINMIKIRNNYSKAIEDMSSSGNINLLCAYDVLRSAKDEAYVYSKIDHHWTQFGAYQGYLLLMNAINKRDSSIKPINKNNYIIVKSVNKRIVGSAVHFLNLPTNVYKYAFSYDTNLSFRIKKEYREKITKKVNERKEGQKEYDSGIAINSVGIPRKVFLFGDSQTINIRDFFFETFQETFYCLKPFQLYMPIIEDMMLEQKPDIAIGFIFEQNFKRVASWYNIRSKPSR